MSSHPSRPSPGYELAAYYFPNFHADSRNEARYGRGWTEWELLKNARPRFPGHRQPKVPLWGYEDEADPAVFAKKIDAAADHGLRAFIFDWYWYEGAPFLVRALEEGYLGAANRERLKFSLMWANHDWLELFPRGYKQGTPRLFSGAVDRREFERVVTYIVENYMVRPEYWKIDGCPYFSIYEMGTFLRGLGGMEETRSALDFFRETVRRAGLPGLHLNMVIWQLPNLPSETVVADPAARLAGLGIDSITSYAWVHHSALDPFPESPYARAFQDNRRAWENYAAGFRQPYFPNVSMGWDPSPRTEQGKPYENLGYPYTSVLSGSTPDAFERALEAAKKFLQANPRSRNILTLNAWNEWTEGSYLEPDTVHGLAYLQALQRVFAEA